MIILNLFFYCKKDLLKPRYLFLDRTPSEKPDCKYIHLHPHARPSPIISDHLRSSSTAEKRRQPADDSGALESVRSAEQL